MGGLERGFGPSKKNHWLNELNNKVVARGKMPLMRESNLISQSSYNHHNSSFFSYRTIISNIYLHIQ